MTTLRSDITPCLLFPSMSIRGGGLVRAVTERASLYARHFERVLLLTTSFSPGHPDRVAELHAAGILDRRVEVRNFFADASYFFDTGTDRVADLVGHYTSHGIAVRHVRQRHGAQQVVALDPDSGRPRLTHTLTAGGTPVLTAVINPETNLPERTFAFMRGASDSMWAEVVASWVDSVLEPLVRPVLFSDQRGQNDPVLLATTRATRRIATLHNNHYRDPVDPSQGVRPMFDRLLSNDVSVDAIVTLTSRQLEELHTDYPAAPLVHIPYSSIPAPVSSARKDPLLVAMVAHLIPRKRVAHAIRAFALALPALPPGTRLEIYGRGAERASLKALIEELDVGERVYLRGFSPDVAAVQAAAACTLLTSEFEGSPLVIRESMSYGTPVVSYDFRYGPSDVIRDGIDGVLVRVQRPEAMAEALIELLRTPHRAEEMGRRASEIGLRFPREEFERRWLDILTAVDP